MADEVEYQGDTSGQFTPILNGFLDAAGEGNEWARNAADKVQDFITGRAIADQAHEAGQQTLLNLDQTKQNLIGMVQSDPRAADLAISLVGDTIGAAGKAHNIDTSGMEGHTRSEIAHAAVQTWAGINPNMARKVLDEYSDHFDDGTKGALDSYIGHMELMRKADDAGAAVQRHIQQELTSSKNSMGYLGALSDEDTGVLNFPPGWGSKMMQDTSLAPQAKAGLFAAYKNLQLNGDPSYSDAGVLADLVDRAGLPHTDPDHPHANEIISHVGAKLTLEDARWLGGIIGPQTPSQRGFTNQMADALADARDQIGNTAAYGRFTNWFLPAVRQTGPEGLDPNSKNFLLSDERMERFKPTGDELMQPVVQAFIAGQRPRGMVTEGNIDLNSRPVVKNADGSISTVRSMSFEDEDGKETLIPTVSPKGEILSEDDAIALYHKTGKHLGKFDNPDNATAYAEQLHNEQAKQYVRPTLQQIFGGR